MPEPISSVQAETDILLEKMSVEKREYLLWRLASEKLSREKSSGPIPVVSPENGVIVGYLRKVAPPSDEEIALLNNLAKQMDPSTTHNTRDLLDRMKAGEVGAVTKFVH